MAAETLCISKLLEIYAWVFTFDKNIEERQTLVNVFLGMYLNISLENILFLVVKQFIIDFIDIRYYIYCIICFLQYKIISLILN